MKYLLVSLLLVSCGLLPKKKEKDVSLPPRTEELKVKYLEKLESTKASAYPSGWLDEKECDGMLWASKYACGGGEPNILLAEYQDQPGRFGRRPAPDCWNPTEGDVGSKTTWSRDMGMGLMSYAWCKKDLGTVSRHADYGEKKNWVMGEPFADGRVLYSPSVIGILFQVIYSLGGPDTTARLAPSIYSKGLTDYQAHLQMLDIWLRGEMNGAKENLSLDVTSVMYERIKEHSDREPNCPFYQYMRGIYDGSLEKTTDLLLTSDTPSCEYVRGGPSVNVSEWLFTAKLTLKKTGAVE